MNILVSLASVLTISWGLTSDVQLTQGSHFQSFTLYLQAPLVRGQSLATDILSHDLKLRKPIKVEKQHRYTNRASKYSHA